MHALAGARARRALWRSVTCDAAWQVYCGAWIDRVRIHTSSGRASAWCGGSGGQHALLRVPPGRRAVGLWGECSEKYVCSLGLAVAAGGDAEAGSSAPAVVALRLGAAAPSPAPLEPGADDGAAAIIEAEAGLCVVAFLADDGSVMDALHQSPSVARCADAGRRRLLARVARRRARTLSRGTPEQVVMRRRRWMKRCGGVARAACWSWTSLAVRSTFRLAP